MSSTAPPASPVPSDVDTIVPTTGTVEASIPTVIDLSEPAVGPRTVGRDDETGTVPGTTISAALYGRHRILLDGLAMLLSRRSSISLAGVSLDEAALLNLCQRERPDVAVVLLDADMNAESIVSVLRRRHRALRIVAVSTRRAWMNGNRLQAAGASVVLPHGTDLNELVDAILSDTDAPEVTMLGAHLARPGISRPLTSRELDVLRLVAAGMTTGEIGPRLGISPKTVENHKQRLFAKLGVQNQAHAVSVAMRAGLIDLRAQRLMADA